MLLALCQNISKAKSRKMFFVAKAACKKWSKVVHGIHLVREFQVPRGRPVKTSPFHG